MESSRARQCGAACVEILKQKQRLTRRLATSLVLLVKRYVCSAWRTQNGVSRALFCPEIASESFLPRVSLGAVLATVRQENSGRFTEI